MTQIEAAPPETVHRPILSELSAQSLSDKCNALARNLWWTWHPEVINLFRDLDPDDRPIVESILQGYTAEETAARLDCSERTVRRVRRRAKQCLERLIAPEGTDR